jgi:phosphohistidine phosphatase
MSKTLLVLRHAKSDWGDEGVADHERPLNRRGKRDAPHVGRLVRDQQLIPDLIVSSTAVRARKTAMKVAKACGYRHGIELREELYEATPEDCRAVLRSLDGNAARVMLVGHNPGLEELVAALTGDTRPLPTAALVHIMLPIEAWSEFRSGTRGELKNFWRPKEID